MEKGEKSVEGRNGKVTFFVSRTKNAINYHKTAEDNCKGSFIKNVFAFPSGGQPW